VYVYHSYLCLSYVLSDFILLCIFKLLLSIVSSLCVLYILMCVSFQADGGSVIAKPAVSVEVEMQQLIDLSDVHMQNVMDYKNMASAVVLLERIVVDKKSTEGGVSASALIEGGASIEVCDTEEGNGEGLSVEDSVDTEVPTEKGVHITEGASDEGVVSEDGGKIAISMPEDYQLTDDE